MDKYKLPTVDSLKEIGFEFEYARLKDVIPYIETFIENNCKALSRLYVFRDADYDEDGNIIDLKDKNDSDQGAKEELWEPEQDLVEIVERLKTGKVERKDYVLHAYPAYKNDAEVLYKIYDRKLRTYYGAKGNLIYRGHRWGLDFGESIKECFKHKILDDLVLAIKEEGLILPAEFNPALIKIKEALTEPEKSIGVEGSLLRKASDHQRAKELEHLHMEFFSSGLTLEKTARLVLRLAYQKGAILAHIENKERTLNYYLRLQSASVKKARDNKKHNKGKNKSKREEVINLFKSNRKLTYKKISEMTGYDRKTIGNYIKEFISG